MPTLDPRIFRAYDIRGKAHEQVTEEGCKRIGQEFGCILKERYKTDAPKVAVGLDARTHGPAFQHAVMEGLKSAGCSVLDIGMTPSPVNYFTVCTQHLDGSIQVTASHNPKEDNGLKLQVREAKAFCGSEIQELRERIEEKPLLPFHSALSSWPKGKGEGRDEGLIKKFDAITPYVTHLTTMFEGVGQGMHVVIDSGNGAAGPTYTQVLKNVGCTVTELYTQPDGEFPNHQPDPSTWDTLKDLQKTVQDRHADIGLAFDGDGDRLGVVDETGTIRTADETLLLLAQDHLTRHPNAPIVFTVSSSKSLETEIKKWGGHPVMEKVGHAFVEHAMEEHHALLGGEQSGHFFCFEDYEHFDDALVAALWILKILKRNHRPFSNLFDQFPKVYQSPERRPYCPDDLKAEIVQKVIEYFSKTYPVNTLDGARIDFGEGSWAGIRQSNTSPCLSVCIEARSEDMLKEVEHVIWEHLRGYPEIRV